VTVWTVWSKGLHGIYKVPFFRHFVWEILKALTIYVALPLWLAYPWPGIWNKATIASFIDNPYQKKLIILTFTLTNRSLSQIVHLPPKKNHCMALWWSFIYSHKTVLLDFFNKYISCHRHNLHHCKMYKLFFLKFGNKTITKTNQVLKKAYGVWHDNYE
jgi:hypothetical protein